MSLFIYKKVVRQIFKAEIHAPNGAEADERLKDADWDLVDESTEDIDFVYATE